MEGLKLGRRTQLATVCPSPQSPSPSLSGAAASPLTPQLVGASETEFSRVKGSNPVSEFVVF